MGSKAGKILPLVAIAIAAYFTAGAALGAGAGAGATAGGVGAGAAGGTAGGIGAGAAGVGGAGTAGLGTTMAGTIATETALTEGLVASGIGAVEGMAGTALAGSAGMSLAPWAGGSSAGMTAAPWAGGGATQSVALTKTLEAGAGAAGGGFFSELGDKLAGMTAGEKLNVGVGALAAGGSIAGAASNAAAQKAALAAQEEEQRLRAAGDKLSISEAELSVQKKLRRVLAAQTVAFNASGINPGMGSAGQLAESAAAEAGEDLDTLATKRSLVDAGGTIYGNAYANRRARITDSLAGGVAGSLLDFGNRASGLMIQKERLA